MEITKLAAAKSQIKTKIWLYFSDDDPVSVHTLAMAAVEIIDQLCKSRGVTSLLSEFRSRIKPERRREVMDRLNKARNFFKHASWRSPNETLFEFTDDQNLFAILFASEGLTALGEVTLETETVRAFIAIIMPEMLINPPPPDQVKIFGDIREHPRAEQKKVAFDALHYRHYGRLPD